MDARELDSDAARERGQTLVEYGLLIFMIAIVAIVFLAAIGLDVAEIFDAMEDALGLGGANSATTAPGVSDATAATGTN